MSAPRQVDHSAIRTNQAFIITLLALGFVLDAPLLIAFVAAVMVIGTIWPEVGLFKRIYRHILRPAGIVRPDVIPDNPEPHRFAQGVGGLFTSASTLALLAGLSTVGWILSWIVIVLAALNLFAGWCAGCAMYYWLNRIGVPGFTHRPLEANR